MATARSGVAEQAVYQGHESLQGLGVIVKKEALPRTGTTQRHWRLAALDITQREIEAIVRAARTGGSVSDLPTGDSRSSDKSMSRSRSSPVAFGKYAEKQLLARLRLDEDVPVRPAGRTVLPHCSRGVPIEPRYAEYGRRTTSGFGQESRAG
eukprot:TRINITY_DN113625_c0_g1_i1.p1 TRINITY_DN113625_c0_g1~~TRINITY_DN113625_c0_g1_i1.p1  ORF type:complete len:170 (+),score=10.23 TRINITY_DN113625_c0_g1_i1:55-510(+)